MTSESTGQIIFERIARLYPLCRSITGDGVRESLRLIAEEIPLEIHEVVSGTPVLDWEVPPEWNIRDAWIKDARGRRVVDFRASNLHVMSYSQPVAPGRFSRDELQSHLHSLPDHPDWIPYRTTYYAEDWGFCLSQHQREALTETEYEVCIDATLEPGALSYGELLVPGESDREVLISTHICHPSLCNDNLSGVAVAVQLAQRLAEEPRRLSYRFLFAPGTIGSLTWLSRNRESLDRIEAGLTLVCLGDDRGLTYKRTIGGRAAIDRAAKVVLGASGEAFEIRDFQPYGYDERQFNSPGFRLPVGSLMRGVHGEFPEYHTSADDLDFVLPGRLEGAFERLLEIFDVLEGNQRYLSLSPYGEPQLGRRGLYMHVGGDAEPESLSIAMLWILQFADGEHDLLEIAERARLPWAALRRAASLLEEARLIEEDKVERVVSQWGDVCGS